MAGRTLFITGAAGMVGRELAAQGAANFDVVALPKAELDVADRAGVAAAVDRARPSVIAHVGAWTNVDGCETD
ncbi:MAG TPA: sugar nucleotide-binding protein, partial [Pirellulaceae bacterium]|nr:sugar nucleotide-binding protein [Pirellulaceae bacterium]